MNNLKIGVYAIGLNENHFIGRMLASVVDEADCILYVDTGSTDQSIETFNTWKRNRLDKHFICHEMSLKPWRFDIPRNVAMTLLPSDLDLVVSIDLDEVLRPGWRQLLEDNCTKDTKQVFYNYIWSFDENGSPKNQFMYHKIHSRHGWIWVAPVHETLKFIGKDFSSVTIPEIVLEHHPNPNKSRSQYLPLLEQAVEENPLDLRLQFYLGREYYFATKWFPNEKSNFYVKALMTLQRFAENPNSWKIERNAAYCYRGHILEELNCKEAAVIEYKKALLIHPTREPLLYAAKFLEKKEAIEALRAALKLPISEHYTMDPNTSNVNLEAMLAKLDT